MSAVLRFPIERATCGKYYENSLAMLRQEFPELSNEECHAKALELARLARSMNELIASGKFVFSRGMRRI